MASSRSASPVAREGSAPSSPQLTPRSKIKAMLAAVDDSSDDETSKSIAKKRLSPVTKLTSTEQSTADLEDDEDDEDDDIFRPRGRLAARMQPIQNQTKDGTSETPNKASEKDSIVEDEDDEELHALPRKRMTRPARSATPESTRSAAPHSSPGLFVSPGEAESNKPSAAAQESESEDDLPADLNKNARFQALVARKREERLAREAEEERKREERAQRMSSQLPAPDADADDDDDVSDISDDDGGRKLTQEVSRPSRKASKKAMEEMNRETQRLSRSLQLAHEVKTKKKITKASLFERFNFKPEGASVPRDDQKLTSSSRPGTPGSAPQTDAEMGDAGTPPSSPPSALKPTAKASTAAVPATEAQDDEMPTLAEFLIQPQNLDKGKDIAIAVQASPAKEKKAAAGPRRQFRVKLPPMSANMVTIDSDDELQILDPAKSKIAAIFDKAPTKKSSESQSLNMLRRLAHLGSPPNQKNSRGRKVKASMTPAELQVSLQQRARAQAKLERERRLDFLRSKGIVVQTEEEREREREQVEDIVARARQEVELIMERERQDAKQARKERKQNGEDDALDWDDSENDDSFEDSDANAEPEEIELSGSEDEADAEDDEEMADGSQYGADESEEEPTSNNPMVEGEAEEDVESEAEQAPREGADGSDDEMDDLPATKSRRTKKHVHIVSDDEDEEEFADAGVKATPRPKAHFPKSPSAPNSGSPQVPTSVLRSASKTFIPGLPVPAAGPAGLGLTQIFAGTMDDSQVGPASGSPQEFMPSLENFPDSQFSATAGDSQQDGMVLDSQRKEQDITSQAREAETQGVQLHFSQSQAHGFDSIMQIDGTQASEHFAPTQDEGFQTYSPLKQRFVEPPQSTVDTVILPGSPVAMEQQDSPLVKRQGKLRRRGGATVTISTLPDTEIPRSPSLAPTVHEDEIDVARAFELMKKAAKKKKNYDRKKSKAKEMVEGEAVESEDEYAGIGGADGEDSSEDDEELRKEMIDDAAGNDVDEGKLAGFHADRERADEAAQVDKLFRDITTGMLRKRRRGGNDFDLSDSDDDGEARRRMKRRQFAKMQKALFADERISKVAENPRNAAFLKSIEDRGSDDEWDFGDNFAEDKADNGDSQSQDAGRETPDHNGEVAIPDSQPKTTATNVGRKRTRMDPPGGPVRRGRENARPATLVDVRRSLSTLLDEPDASLASIIPATEVGSDSENEESRQGGAETASSPNKENRAPGNTAVVDRISLKRNDSSFSNGAGSSRLAFAAPAAGNAGGFKVPALLRRATTNSLISNTSTSSSGSGGMAGVQMTAHTGKAGGFGEEGKLKKNAGKGSGINYFARENERRSAVEEGNRRREKKKLRGVEGRSKVVGGLFGGGTFE